MPTSPYSTAQDALDIAIVAANDGGGPAGMDGNILNPDTNPQVLPAFIGRWVYLQQRLISESVDTFTADCVVKGLTPGTNLDPKVPVTLSWSGYWDGTSLNDAIVLPTNLVKPLEVWECQDSNASWATMRQAPDEINAGGAMGSRQGVWMFEHDLLIMPGCNNLTDLKLKFLAMAPAITSFASPLMVRGCESALAYLVLYELSGGRGGSMATMYKTKSEEAINQIINQTVRKQAYTSFARKPFHARRRGM